MQSSSTSRPLGVTILAILNIISGIIMLVGGIGAVTGGAMLPMMYPGTLSGVNVPGAAANNLSGISTSVLGGGLIAVGAVLIALGIFSFVVAWGLLKGRGWAWTATVVLAIINIIVNAISLAGGNFAGIVNIIISGIVLYYLYRPHVKTFFGKGIRGYRKVV